jgi:hypothetical protein
MANKAGFNADFDKIFKEVILPFAKQLGFIRKGKSFIRTTHDLIQCFDVQKSSFNHPPEYVSFTFNFGFYHEEIARVSCLGPNTNPTRIYTVPEFPTPPVCFLYDRLGNHSHGSDTWYDLNARTNPADVAKKAQEALEGTLQPIFKQYQSLDELKYFPTLRMIENHNVYAWIAYLIVTKQEKDAKEAIKDHYKQSLIPLTHYINGKHITEVNQSYVNGMKALATFYGADL